MADKQRSAHEVTKDAMALGLEIGLSSLTADQLAEPMLKALALELPEDVLADVRARVAELQTRANQLPEALKVGRAQRLYAAERRAEAAEKERDKAQDSWRLSAAGLVAAEKERDEAKAELSRVWDQNDYWKVKVERNEAEARLAELDAETKRNEREMLARLAETQKALEAARSELSRVQALTIAYKAAVDDEARCEVVMAIGEAAAIARAALTTHPADE